MINMKKSLGNNMFNSKYAANAPLFSMDPWSVAPKHRLYHEVAPLYVGLDTETTGLLKNKEAFPLSIGICVYRNGIHSPQEDHHIITLPPAKTVIDQPQEQLLTPNNNPIRKKQLLTPNGNPIRFDLTPESEAVHGLSENLLSSSYHGRITQDKHGTILRPALEHGAAINKVFSILAHYQKQGAVFVGHNLSFDWDMLERSHEHENDNMSPATAGFNMVAARKYTADSKEHATARRDGAPGFRKDYRSGIMIPVSDSRRLEDLCPAWGVDVGGHASLGDARASVELLLKQIAKNQEQMGSQGIRLSSVGQSGIDYSMAGPHDGKQCNFCRHLDEVSSANRDETGSIIDRNVQKSIELARGFHRNPEKMKGSHPMTPQLVLTEKEK
jgi:DNA polymerase III epsilon subunit-like protein